jgi:hypothetical protein
MITELELISFGYRELNNSKVWAKPIGFMIFIFEFEKQEISLWFKSAGTKDKLIWNSEKVESLIDLKCYEHYNQGLGKGSCQTEFEFLNPLEIARFQLGVK